MTDQSIPHKTCSKCKIAKPVTAFRKRNRTTQDHLLMSWCKACRSEYNKAYQKNPRTQAMHAEYQQQYQKRGPATEARCNKCEQTKPASQFYKNRSASNGLSPYCIDCRIAFARSPESREYRRKYASLTNGEEKNRERRRNWRLKKMFGITLADYDLMYKAQNGGCAMCGERDDLVALHVDHDHSTGKVRALLCSRHNLGLGCFRDNIKELQTAIEYLKRHG